MRTKRSPVARELRPLYALRSQQAVVLAVFALLVADAVALVRQPELWIERTSRNQVLGTLLTLALCACIAEVAILRSRRSVMAISRQSLRMAAVAALPVVVLVFCPEWPFDNPTATAHVLTVAAGALVVFLPVRVLVRGFVPCLEIDPEQRWRPGDTRAWVFLLVGVLMGALGFWADGRHLTGSLRHLHPASLAVALTGLLFAFGFLGEPLGFLRRFSAPSNAVAGAEVSSSGSNSA